MVTFEATNARLIIRLIRPVDRDDVLAIRKRNPSVEGMLAELCETVTGNSAWEWVSPEDIGALTSAPILSDEVEQNDRGETVKVGRVFWFPDYAIRCPVEDLLERGFVEFPGGPENGA